MLKVGCRPEKPIVVNNGYFLASVLTYIEISKLVNKEHQLDYALSTHLGLVLRWALIWPHHG